MKLAESALSWTGAIVIGIVGALAMLEMLQSASAWQWTHSAVLTLGLLQLALFLCYARQTTLSATTESVLFWLQAANIAALYTLVDVVYIAILGIVWTVQACERLPLRQAILAMTGMILLFAASRLLHPLDSVAATFSSIVTLGLFHIFALVVTHRFWREQQLREQASALNRELLATRELLAQQSRQYERLRISRDLHDTLGHHLTALILQLEVASHQCSGEPQEKVRQSLQVAKNLIGELRKAVSELRERDNIDLHRAVERLIEDLPGLTVQLDFSAAPVVHETSIAETLLRCIQECLTNIMRHSNADHCHIRLSKLYNHYFLTVQDNGTKTGEVTAGNGLSGMRERVSLLGGELQWQQEGDGFLVQIKLPMETCP